MRSKPSLTKRIYLRSLHVRFIAIHGECEVVSVIEKDQDGVSLLRKFNNQTSFKKGRGNLRLAFQMDPWRESEFVSLGPVISHEL